MNGSNPELLRIPERFHTVDEVLGVAKHLSLKNVLVLSETDEGDLIILDSSMSCADVNWLLDRIKVLLTMPDKFRRIMINDRQE